MENIYGLTGDELHALIVENLKSTGIDPELISITIKKGPRVVLKGEIDSKRERDLVVQTITDIVGIDEVIDSMNVMDPRQDYLYQDDDDDEDELLDEDNESMGTEDISRSVEDGVPYVPPMTSRFNELEMRARQKERRRRSDIYW